MVATKHKVTGYQYVRGAHLLGLLIFVYGINLYLHFEFTRVDLPA